MIVDIIVPVFGIVLIGFLAGKTRFFNDADIEGLTKFVFNFAIPVMLFETMANTTLPDQIEWGFLLSYYIGAFGVYGLAMVFGKVAFSQTLTEQGVFGLGAAYSNMVLLGVPLVLLSFGDEATVPLFLLISVHSGLMFFTVSVLGEVGRGEGKSFGALAWSALKGLIGNPIFGGLMLGTIFNLLNWTLPDAIGSVIQTLGSAALPSAVFALGASLSLYRLAGQMPQAMTMVLLKILVHPIIVWVMVTFVFEVDPLWASVAIVMAALPVGINVYLFAMRYRVVIAPSATAVLVSTGLSVATISLLLWWLQAGT
jgi:predicted permease